VPLEKISLRISGAANGTATLQGSAKAGGGTLEASGGFKELTQATRSMTLKVSGSSAEIFNWPEYHVWASPDLTLTGDKDGWQLGGGLTIPRAEINVREIPVEAITPSEDVIVLGEEDVVRARTRIGGETRIKLGDKVRIKALGLDSGLAGELLVKLHYDSEPTAEGRITLVDGSFASQGQKLAIQKGELTFTGPLDNPIVDVRAVRVIENFEGTVTAGIHLHGRAQNLTSTVFSEPAMNEVDALSYLVIGRPLNQATEAEGGQLSGAAVSMGLRQASRLTDQIGQTLGLDQLSLTGDGGDTTALIAGKKVNSRLYARYAYGVFSRLGVLLLRYRLSNRLSLEAGAGESQSIDILYSVEKR
jgi:translocation and assembly module TamB